MTEQDFQALNYTVSAQVTEPTEDEYEEITKVVRGFIVSSQHIKGDPQPFGPDGKPRMLVISAWMAHEGRNLNGDAFVKEELQKVVNEGLFAPPYAGMIDDDHDFTARGYWYKTSFAFDQVAKRWGILATGALWAWRYADLADRLLADMSNKGLVDVSMSVIAGHTEVTLGFPESRGEKTKVLHNPVFFTTSLLSVPPGDKFARGRVAENPNPEEITKMSKDIAMAGVATVINDDVDPQNYSTKNDGHERPGDGPKDPGKAIPAPVGGSMEKTDVEVVAAEQDQACMDPNNDTNWEAEEADLLAKSERKTKTVDGKHLTAEKFACVGDPQKTETWKLPIHDANHVRNALARFNQAEGCNTPAVKAKILRAAKHFGIDAESLKKAGYEEHAEETKKAEDSAAPTEAAAPVEKKQDPQPDGDEVGSLETDKAVEAKSVEDSEPDATETGANTDKQFAETKTEDAAVKVDHQLDPNVKPPVVVKNDLKNNSEDSQDFKEDLTDTAGGVTNVTPTKNKVSVEDSKTAQAAPTKKVLDDQAKQARKAAIAKMQTFIRPSEPVPSKKKVITVANLTMAAGVPTTRTPQGDGINDHLVSVADPAPTGKVMTVEVPNSQQSDGKGTVVLKDSDSFTGDGDTPGDSTTRGPDADSISTNKTVVIEDVTKTNKFSAEIVGATAIRTLRFAKTFWKTTDGVLAFLVNEGFGHGYQVDAAGKIVNHVRDTGAYLEVEVLPVANFKAGTFVDHCIAAFGGDCAIVATIGEVASTVKLEISNDKVKSLAAPAPITLAFAEHHIKRVAYLEAESLKVTQELADTKARLAETEGLLTSALKDKSKLANAFEDVKIELAEKIAEAKLMARLEDLPSIVKAQLQRNSHKDDIIQFLRTASDQEWELARRTFALAKHQSFTELSEEEGKLPVGGGSTSETKTLQEYLR